MAKDVQEWVLKVEADLPEMVKLAMRLQQEGVSVKRDVTRIRHVDAVYLVATFTFGSTAMTRIFFQLMDHQTNSDVVISHMTTLPENAKGKGFGSKALQIFLAWAAQNNFHEVRATQVHFEESKRFWEKNGFTRYPNPNPCGDYVRQC